MTQFSLLLSFLFLTVGCARKSVSEAPPADAPAVGTPRMALTVNARAEAVLRNARGRQLGKVFFDEDAAGVRVQARVGGLRKNGKHGFHVHEGSRCDGPTFDSAGGHFNPLKAPHGGHDTVHRHPGDLGNLQADGRGMATLDERIQGATVIQGVAALVGKTLILHQGEDDLRSQPSGNSGKRMACGLIKLSSVN